MICVFAICVGFVLYINDYYHADDIALSILEECTTENGDTGVTITNEPNKMIVFAPQNPKVGFIFYPGGKVQYESYAPLLYKLAQNDILCILVHMPGNLAVYSTVDLTESGLSVLSIYGSEDGVLDKEKYYKYATNLPSSITEVIIEGGCHAYFGNYGEQTGDGTALISREEQISKTVDEIVGKIEEAREFY